MPSLKDIRRRIASVKSTQKITRAMKLVAAAKLRRAQENIIKARPYALKVRQLTADLVDRAGDLAHPLLTQRPATRVMLVVLTSDRGLCGAFNANIIRTMEAHRQQGAEAGRQVSLGVVGRKGGGYCNYRNIPLEIQIEGLDVSSSFDISDEIATQLISRYSSGEVDQIQLIYNEFRSAMVQDITIRQLLPVAPTEPPAAERAEIDYLYEPEKQAVFDSVLPMYVRTEVHRSCLETVASEHGARMTAMESATDNASDIIRSLTLEYNKARQSAITKELLEIVAGAEAT